MGMNNNNHKIIISSGGWRGVDQDVLVTLRYGWYGLDLIKFTIRLCNWELILIISSGGWGGSGYVPVTLRYGWNDSDCAFCIALWMV